MTQPDGRPVLEELTASEIARLFIPLALSKDPSDQAFAEQCKLAIRNRTPAQDREIKERRRAAAAAAAQHPRQQQ